MTSYRKTEDFDYQCQPFDAPEPLLAAAGKRWLDLARNHRLSGGYMPTLKPIPGKAIYKPEVFEERIRKCAKDYEKATGVRLRHAGFITNGPKGNAKCEAHLLFPTGFKVCWPTFKRVFRTRFDVVVTGRYEEGERIPKKVKLKNRPAHGHCLKYVASHADHVDACALWSLAAPKPKRKKRMKETLPMCAGAFATPSDENWLDVKANAEQAASLREFRTRYRV